MTVVQPGEEPREELPVGSEWYTPQGGGTHHDTRVAANKAALRSKNVQILHHHAKGGTCSPDCETIDYRDLPEWTGTGIAL